MQAFKYITHIYFIGIGGIGMSALARYFKKQGKTVGGYDREETKITQSLAEEGILLSHDISSGAIPKVFLDAENTLVVYTPAISETNEQWQYFKEQHFLIKKRAEVLGMISSNLPTLAIAGTHGKTTTTAILAHLLKQSGYKITAFLGGISENYQSNYIGDGNDVMVVEADEYDRSFLQLSPDYVGITSTDDDHLDIYQESKHLQHAFSEFMRKVPDLANVFVTEGVDFEGNKIGFTEGSAYHIKNVSIKNGNYIFDLETPKVYLAGLEFSLPGRYNLTNASMAMAMALTFGASPEVLKQALKSFTGVDRRFTYHLKTPKVLIEDYAHHPTEIKAVAQAVKEMYPEKETLAIFQPHLYSRTRDFSKEFSASLSVFDQVVLLPIYPAREKPIEGVNAAMLLEKINTKKQLVNTSKLPIIAAQTTAEVIVVMGAGDIGKEVVNIKAALKHEN